MASLISHAVAALSIGSAFKATIVSRRTWFLAAACSVVPDLDVIGFRFGIPYPSFWGHRGFTHSILFAGILACLAVALSRQKNCSWSCLLVLWSYFFLSTASHGFLDAMTNGGLGVAFFSPFDNARYFLPWRPILVSPISLGRFLSSRGLAVLRSELIWIWIPSALFALFAFGVRRAAQRPTVNP
jgi:inner membrane protein